MTPRRLKIGLALFVGLLLGAFLSPLFLGHPISEVGYGPSDKAVIQLAMGEWARANHADSAKIAERHYPAVVHLPSKTCVELRLREGIAGLAPVYCINEESGKIVERYTDGE